MKYLIRLLLISSILLICSSIFAQENQQLKTHSISLKTQFFQFNDEFNYGLVFNGLNMVGQYTFEKESFDSYLVYSSKIAFGANFNKGVGLAWQFTPIDIFYGYQIKEMPLYIGPYFAANYQWQLYPELQSGHMFWFTALEVGYEASYTLPYNYKSRKFKLSFANAFAGFASRPEPSTETHFYSLTISDFFSNAHSDLEFGFNNLFNHTRFEIEMLRKPEKRLSLAYEFEYFGYFDTPTVNYLNHSFNLKWKIGKR